MTRRPASGALMAENRSFCEGTAIVSTQQPSVLTAGVSRPPPTIGPPPYGLGMVEAPCDTSVVTEAMCAALPSIAKARSSSLPATTARRVYGGSTATSSLVCSVGQASTFSAQPSVLTAGGL